MVDINYIGSSGAVVPVETKVQDPSCNGCGARNEVEDGEYCKRCGEFACDNCTMDSLCDNCAMKEDI